MRLAQLPLVRKLASSLPKLESRTEFLRVAQEAGIRWASATRLPLADASMGVVYSSHMLEHLDREHAERFLREAQRVLRPGGVLRLVVPDLKQLVQRYVDTGDADRLVDATLLVVPPARSWLDRVQLTALGHRGHAWMYDATSLTRLVESVGFADVRPVVAGETRIPSPEPLDLHEREDESLYVEATRAS